MQGEGGPAVIYTIGYGGRSPGEFVKLLVGAGVRTVADVRLWPHRASMGSYVKARSAGKGIEALLAGAGISYCSCVELGNLFLEYPDWKTRYRAMLERAGDLLLARLVELERPCCLLCAEKDPLECHRSLIADHLVAGRYAGRVVHL